MVVDSWCERLEMRWTSVARKEGEEEAGVARDADGDKVGKSRWHVGKGSEV